MADPELHAVETALNTLVLAESESALQKVLLRLLPALLAALSTKSDAARTKCIEALQHINVRIRANPNMKLPFNEVLHVATKPDAAVLTTNVAIQGGYLGRCFERLSRAEKGEAFKPLVTSASIVASDANRGKLHNLGLYALAALSAEHVKSTSTYLWRALSTCSELAISMFFDFSFLALFGKLNAQIPEPALVAVIRVASEYAGNKQPERAARVFPHFLVAAGSSSRSSLLAAGEDALKKVDKCDVITATDPSIVEKLFNIFTDPIADVPLRIVVLNKGLLIVPLCASCFPEVLSVVKLSLHTPGIPTRLQALGMQFVSFVIKHADQDVLVNNADSMIELLMQLALNKTYGSPSFSDAVRAFGFSGLGELTVRIPDLISTGRVSTEFLFASAQSTDQPSSVRSSASHTLIAIARVLKFSVQASPELHASVVKTLKKTLENSDDSSTSARRAAVHWVNECFLFADSSARLLNIIAAADLKQDVRQQALVGLSSKRWSFKDGKTLSAYRNANESAKPALMEIVQKFSELDASHPLMIEAYLTFSLSILKEEIATGGKLELTNLHDINRFFDERQSEKNALVNLSKVANEVIMKQLDGRNPSLEKAALSIALLTSKITSLGRDCSARYVDRIDDLVELAAQKSALGDIMVSRAISSLVGIASDALPVDGVNNLVEKLNNQIEANSSGIPSGRDGEDERVASILCLGQIIMRCRKREEIALDENETSPLSKACLNMSRRLLLPVESTNVVRIAACIAFSDLGASGQLPISLSSRENFVGVLSGLLKSHSTDTKLTQNAADTLGKICVGEPRSSFKERAIDTLLHLCKERKDDEVRFTAAESLVRCSSGFDAPPPATLDSEAQNLEEAPDNTVSETLQAVTSLRMEPFEIKDTLMAHSDDKTELNKLGFSIRGAIALAYDERPTARAGGCVCLVTFLRLLGKHSDTGVKLLFRTSEDESRFMQQQRILLHHLEDIQRAFTVLLGDRSDFIQQMSSCGIALAYRMCPPNQQSDLVSALVRSLTSGKTKSAATVPGDQGTLLELGGIETKDNAAAPKSATFKELCTLAQDMGQPELVYKFMDLAGHAALWNNRKGAALAGSALLGGDLAAEQLRPHIKDLLPRLYVYCYDPTESVRTAMSSILGAIIKASGMGSVYEAVTEHFDLVIDFCKKSIVARQWRSREAGCAALRDALASRTWEQVKGHISDFWYYTLRSMDDIKETVRKAATSLGRALSELSIHLCDPDRVSVDIARAAVAVIIPSVMRGLTHADRGVQTLCGTTMTKLVRYGGDALRDSVADLVSLLLEVASASDEQALNYLQFHVSDPEALEEARVSAATTSASPLMDALERLSGLVDETNVADTVRSLMRLAKLGVGIPTRAGTARFFSTLLKSRAAVVAPYAAKLMISAMAAAEMETNTALRNAWCSAAGTSSKLCSTLDVAYFVDQIVKKADSEDSRDRLLASCLAVGFSRESPDTARQHASALLPIAYMGSHETDDESSTAGSNWREVWSEGAPNTEASLRLYAKEITNICQQRLKTSSQYRVKRSAAMAIGALAKASNESVNLEYVRKGVNALVESVPGHIWDGKGSVVEAIGIIGENYSNLSIWSDLEGPGTVVKLLLGETRRGNSEYKLAAIKSIQKLLKMCREQHDLFNEVYERLKEYWSTDAWSVVDVDENGISANISRVIWETGSDANAVDARNKARKARRMLCANSIRCLESSFVGGRGKSDIMELAEQREKFKRLVHVCGKVPQSDWEGWVAAIESLSESVKRCDWSSVFEGSEEIHEEISQRVAQVVITGMSNQKFAAVRRVSYECVGRIGELAPSTESMRRSFGTQVCQMIIHASTHDVDSVAQLIAKKTCQRLSLLGSGPETH